MFGCYMKSAIIFLVVTLHLCMVAPSSPVNKIRQKRAWIIDSFSIEEEHPGPYPYVLGNVHVDRDYRVKFKLHGNGVDEDPKGVLSIDPDTGVISVLGKLDYEKYPVLKLKFEARNVSNQQLDTRLGVEITIKDVNDQAPTFREQLYEISIEESMHQGTNVITMLATDDDRAGSLNAKVRYSIKSVTPSTPDSEFFIEENGRITFKGCLDYEKANKYTIVVEAKDRGEKVQLSSSTTVIVNVLDKNNHMPVFAGRTGVDRVMERASGMTLFRIHVTDKDTKGTAAWRVKYTIKGDKHANFQIETDPENNDGILSVVKPLDYEEDSERQLTITAENEDPYFSCQLNRKSSGTLWKVTNVDGDPGRGGTPVLVSQDVTILVDDVNDPPEFTYSTRTALVDEDEGIGHLLETFTAKDSDGKSADDIEYVVGDDPANWVRVDPKTGAVTTANVLDRESEHVVNGTYIITLYAIDRGEPQMTATATLTLHVADKNDNLPQLRLNTMSICLSDENTMTNITAYDDDGDPYGGPFRFELLGDEENRWSLDTNYGYTVNLIKKSSVYAGFHQLQLKIYDRQEQFSVHNISIATCDCSVRPDCWDRGASSSSQINGAGIGIILLALLALLGILLLAFLLTCGREKFELPIFSDTGDGLLPSNIETPGTDCKMPETPKIVKVAKVDQQQTAAAAAAATATATATATAAAATATAAQGFYGAQNGTVTNSSNHQVTNQIQAYQEWYQREAQSYHQHHSNSAYKTMTLQQSLGHRTDRYKTSMLSGHHSMSSKGGSVFMGKEALFSLVSQRLSSIQAVEEVLCDYDPKVYTYEESSMANSELDRISIEDGSFVPDDLLYLGPRFHRLATICNPTPEQP
ncbi:hypothetical protein COCON_G00179330 [Conger conger]|uniref:Cadherin domain-containing protein n=1 Tax=Conger conger TaxID=82655 RepID=A0A9Q1D5F5_CONCO|nr:hypothetical protein COCON_G00179330 [Conger conger]